jgi:hypothetical protein
MYRIEDRGVHIQRKQDLVMYIYHYKAKEGRGKTHKPPQSGNHQYSSSTFCQLLEIGNAGMRYLLK